MKKVLEFLQDLSQNNDKEWFHANRDRYEESRDTMLFVTEVLINEIRKFDPEISVMNPKDCMFRIFRDVRFSNDKRPYKTNWNIEEAVSFLKNHSGSQFDPKCVNAFVGQ